MSSLSRILRAFLRLSLVWLLPGMAMLAALAAAFLFWLVGTQGGTRLLLSVAAQQFEGRVEGVRGSVLHGLRVDHLALTFGGTGIEIDDFALDVDWHALGERHLHVRDLAAARLHVSLGEQAGAASDDAGGPLSLPLKVSLDRLAIGEFALTRGEESMLPVALGNLVASASGGQQGVQARVDNLDVDHARWVFRGAAALGADLMPHRLSADLMLEGRPALSAALDRQPVTDRPGIERITGTVRADRFDLGGLLGPGLPPAVLSARAVFDAEVADLQALRQAGVDLTFEDGSRWNGQPLSGRLAGRIENEPTAPAAGVTGEAALSGLPAGWRLEDVRIDLRLGGNRVHAQGRLGADGGKVSLDVDAPGLEAFWPGLPGGAKAGVRVEGTVAQHRATLEAVYTPPHPRASVLGSAPLRAEAALEGGWGQPAGETAGWRGTVSRLTAASAGYTAALQRPMSLTWLPDARAPQWQVQAGATILALAFPGRERIVLAHTGSRLGEGRWQTAGRAEDVAVTDAMLRQLRGALGEDVQPARRAAQRAGQAERRIALDASWDLHFDGALSGKARVARRSGDLRIPGPPPVALGLQALALDVSAVPSGPGASRLEASLLARSDRMGTLRARASAMLAGLGLAPRRPLRVELDADMGDLSWLNLFTGDALEVGGALQAQVQAQGTPEGGWTATGQLRGSKLRLLRVDDGVRLLDGTLLARLEGDRVILESLKFPAVQRVAPGESRTREWVESSPDAQGGFVEARGQWHLPESRGRVDLTLYRYPIMQRSDRYAMVSGNLSLDAALPRLMLTGRVTADAGWASLEILQAVPTLDDDVRVLRPGRTAQAQEGEGPSLIFGMDVEADVGQRFYLTGMGLDTGLVGSLRVAMHDGRITGTGSLRTRGGSIQAYGQRLRLRRGVVTFQGRIDNPLLDIEALRTDVQQVQAGVRVAGTAQRPRIDLISYPEVSDVEKLSWLVMGRGPDASGADTAMLISAGTALLGGGEPFYKQFGLDDLSVRTGSLGSSGSLLPDRTVAGDVNRDSGSDLATQFIVASKRFANGITLSLEQAMSGTETVGRASYRLARGLSLDLKAGGVNGLALVYRWFLDD